MKVSKCWGKKKIRFSPDPHIPLSGRGWLRRDSASVGKVQRLRENVRFTEDKNEILNFT